MAYAYVKNGSIVEGPVPLPVASRNVSGLDRSSPQELLALGWLPVIEDDVPDGHTVTGRSYAVVGNEVIETVTTEPPAPPAAADVQTESARRLAVGFPFDFQDGRGVHQFGTTVRDMAGWDEVSKVAQALIALGQSSQTIAIKTDTGPCEVTAMEWQSVLLAAAAFRQPIWGASFILQATDPIPADYTADKYWP